MEKKRIALRKLLEAVEKEILRKPDRKTLDHLSLLAGFQDWESFQKAIHGETSAKKGSSQEPHLLSYSTVTGRRFSLMRAALPVSLRR